MKRMLVYSSNLTLYLALSQMDINYDITLLVEYTNKCFTNKPLHHAVYKRSLNDKELFHN